MILATLVTDREWWPPGDTTPAYYCHWTLVAAFNCSLVATAVLTWGDLGLGGPARVAGGGLTLVGTAVFAWGARPMGSEETMGVTGDLYTGGPYAYTRNPQYLGMIAGVTGFALLSDSLLVAALAAAHVGWVLLLPRAEEPHLRAEFGEAYDWRDVARPMPFGLSEDGDGEPSGETFEWALATDDCGDCTFYEEVDGRGACAVHDARPLICQTYPFSVGSEGESRRDDGGGLGATEPMGGVVEREGLVRAHECEGLGRDISREDAEELAAALKERAVRELEEAIGVRDGYEPTDVDGVVVHDSEGQKRPDGSRVDETNT
ncbi:hypothetical protein EXE53_20610 [Halorubrum sp. SD626R]|uniref:methyltransferase n=1 Tax=Halorubrum sp. SD626R TaxID=1419722 RepID=UPI0010F7D953|nr:hypothetical protein EXE53_20610 [Halorubrum sp. SD626R]